MLTNSAQASHFWMASLLCITDLMPAPPEFAPQPRLRPQGESVTWQASYPVWGSILLHMPWLLSAC
ncbi:hypothetical protein [Comamonas jiangduensis]|uniref:hypothetical protein n=1 Tax=Comamonas jiangduensis TaxID=1194168 RepID=UPI0028AB1258|nr:hypothetical protein [Comamonas jiangduensis]